MKHQLRVSVVIPAYNEERLLAKCLSALSLQTVPPFEVLVVDNNSRDRTAAIAREFGVRLLLEKTQGITYARTCGFNAAKGDIIARIDADTIVAPDWIEQIVHSFSTQDIVGVGGTSVAQELSPEGKFWFKSFLVLFRRWHERHLGLRQPLMYGNNMAITRAVWALIADKVNFGDDKIAEDVDISILAGQCGKILYNKNMLANCHAVRLLQLGKLRRYARTDRHTIALHKRLGNL